MKTTKRGGGVTVVRAESAVPGPAGTEQHEMTAGLQTIQQDGTYADEACNRFQFRKGHPLTAEQLKRLTRVGDFPVATGPAAEFAQTAPPSAESEADAKAEAAPENKAAPAPKKKTDD